MCVFVCLSVYFSLFACMIVSLFFLLVELCVCFLFVFVFTRVCLPVSLIVCLFFNFCVLWFLWYVSVCFVCIGQ